MEIRFTESIRAVIEVMNRLEAGTLWVCHCGAVNSGDWKPVARPIWEGFHFFSRIEALMILGYGRELPVTKPGVKSMVPFRDSLNRPYWTQKRTVKFYHDGVMVALAEMKGLTLNENPHADDNPHWDVVKIRYLSFYKKDVAPQEKDWIELNLAAVLGRQVEMK